jgi:hypothetical protein
MTGKLPLLPLGMTVFEELRQRNAVYVDKTKYIPQLLEGPKFIFCARPRRFGKSLTVNTIDAFCSGKKELFRGLEVEKLVSSPDFVVRPVIRLDMSMVAGSDNNLILSQKIMERLEKNAQRHNVSFNRIDCPAAFLSLLENVQRPSGQSVILLIDEYDSPIIQLAQRNKLTYDNVMLEERRIIMQNFYEVIKGADAFIRLAFITGVTKFSRRGVFSSLNNLTDISLSTEYSAFMGYTQEELEKNFAPFIAETALELKISEEKLLKKLNDRYDGFSFDGKQKLYNPFSILSFFCDNKFDNFWIKSGSNTIVREFMREKSLTVD